LRVFNRRVGSLYDCPRQLTLRCRTTAKPSFSAITRKARPVVGTGKDGCLDAGWVTQQSVLRNSQGIQQFLSSARERLASLTRMLSLLAGCEFCFWGFQNSAALAKISTFTRGFPPGLAIPKTL